MIDMNKAKKNAQTWLEHRNRHHDHKEGDTLYYYCKDIKKNRAGKVYMVVSHYGINSYVLEVETGPPINESFLKLVSEFQVEDGE